MLPKTWLMASSFDLRSRPTRKRLKPPSLSAMMRAQRLAQQRLSYLAQFDKEQARKQG